LDLQLTLTRGRIDILDDAEEVLSVIGDVALKYRNETTGGSIDAAGIVLQPENSGDIAIKGEWSTPADRTAPPTILVDATLNDWPVEIVAPVVAAQSAIDGLSGRFTSSIAARVTPGSDGAASVSAELRVVPRAIQYRERDTGREHNLTPREMVARVDGHWDRVADRIELAALSIDSDVLALSGQGSIRHPRGAAVIDLQGRVSRDLTPFLDLLPADFRKHVSVDGLRLERLSAKGALRPELLAEAEPVTLAGQVTWDVAELFGIEAQPGSIRGDWDGHRVALQPQDVTVSGGQLAALPDVTINSPLTLLAAPGPMLVNVEFTEDQCRGWLRFLSPVLADATSADGRFTLAIDGGRFPIGDAENADVAGTLHVHSGRIGPGPLALKTLAAAAGLAEIVTQREPEWARGDVWLELPEQDVAFRMREGRVFHEAFLIRIGELEIISRGSVGLDETLDVTLEMPLPDKWLDRGPILNSLKGESVTVRLQGTLDNPRIDNRELLEFGKRIGFRAAGGLLQKLLERRSERAAERATRRADPPTAP
jgi:hypothetical protein